jgi:hypothetical protein
LFGPGIAYAQNRATQKEENLTHNKAANYNWKELIKKEEWIDMFTS